MMSTAFRDRYWTCDVNGIIFLWQHPLFLKTTLN